MAFSKIQMPLNLKLRYRNSFIDVDDQDGDMTGGSQVRASSTPPAFLRTFEEVDENENGLRFYVENLSKKLQAEGYDAASPSASTEEGAVPRCDRIVPLESEAKKAHPSPPATVKVKVGFRLMGVQFCPAPEVWVTPRSAAVRASTSWQATVPTAISAPIATFLMRNLGGSMMVLEKTPKLDKRQRTIMQGLSRRELLALVLHFCRLKAEQDVRNLHKTLARMNFSNLIGLVTHQSPSRAKQTPESAEKLADALERITMRLQAAWSFRPAGTVRDGQLDEDENEDGNAEDEVDEDKAVLPKSPVCRSRDGRKLNGVHPFTASMG
ncbi:unnamed protein product [Cladocopium goreaui]|uniref:Metal tolerance protein C1 n=1 Tax=Cladocopium goreaui TaxID=2562237 RepID=A0A9P1FDV5_9DINO|nr:unnamed protein product [Cladocopium goreaui]